MTHKLAGTPVQEQDIIDVQTLVDAYFDNAPDITDPTQLVSFGTSGHRGTSLMVLLQIYMWRLLHKLFVMAVVNSVPQVRFLSVKTHMLYLSQPL